MAAEPTHCWHAYSGTERDPRLAAANCDGEFVRSLQTRVLASIERPDSGYTSATIDKELDAAPADGGSEAAGDVITADLANRAPVANPPIHCSNAAPVSIEQFCNTIAMSLMHRAEQCTHLFL